MIAAASKKGSRKVNQDRCRYNRIGNCICMVVADGNGGDGGSLCSQVAADTGMACLSIALSNGVQIENDDQLREIGIQAVSAAAEAVMELKGSNSDFSNAGTTFTVVLVTPTRIGTFWVGDSSAYLYHAGDLVHLTYPQHTLAQMLIDQGKPESIRKTQPHLCSVLTRCLGHERPEPDWKILPLEGSSLLLAGSDGIFGFLPETALIQILRNNFPKCFDMDELVSSIIETSILVYNSDDNCTLIGCLAQPEYKPQKQERRMTRLCEWR